MSTAELHRLVVDIDLAAHLSKAEFQNKLKEALDSPALTEAYKLLFQSLGNEEAKKLELLQEAHKQQSDDSYIKAMLALCRLSLNQGPESLEVLEHLAHEQPEDPFLLRAYSKGLFDVGKTAESLSFAVKATKIDPGDHLALVRIGLCHTKTNNFVAAEGALLKAKELNPNSVYCLKALAFVRHKRGGHSDSLELLDAAFNLDPSDSGISKFAVYVQGFLKGSSQPESAADTHSGLSEREKVHLQLAGVVENIKGQFKTNIGAFLAEKNKAESKRQEFLNHASLFEKDISAFMVLRKWNSYTPALPVEYEDRSIGGGYFIYHKGTGTVIDPGFNFIENFANAGGRIIDIDNIVITHAHNDHTNDFESIMTLLYQYNEAIKKKYNQNDEYTNYLKKVNIYLNIGSFMKLSGLIDLNDHNYIDRFHVMSENSSYALNDKVVMTALPAYHNETVSKYYSLGVNFKIEFGDFSKNILFTSDTGLLPRKKEDNKVVDLTGIEIQERYKSAVPGILSNVDVLVVHIGSIGENEFKAELCTDSTIDLEKTFYPNHLGVHGSIRLISEMNPKLAIISEFGEELKEFREGLVKLMEEAVNDMTRNELPKPRVIPGDISLIYYIREEQICCALSKKMVSLADIEYSYPPKKHDFYFYDKGQRGNLRHMDSFIKIFNNERRDNPLVIG